MGFEIRRFDPSLSEAAQFMRQLSVHGVNLVLDVGANIGQFGRKNLRDAGYVGRIVSFEPSSAAWEKLCKEIGNDPKWEAAPRTAIGDVDGEVDIHIAQNSVSSSVLEMLQRHTDAAPGSQYVGKERAPLQRLDSLASKYVFADTVPFLKIDTQGFEDKVLAGAPQLLNRIVGAQLELTLVPLYEGQRLYDEMIAQLKNLGFDLWAISPAFIEASSGRVLQVDATFFKH
jgi:FkbM family methyltransferase